LLIIKSYSRLGKILEHGAVANLLLSLTVKKIENRLTFGDVMGKSLVSCFFLTGSVGLLTFCHLAHKSDEALLVLSYRSRTL